MKVITSNCEAAIGVTLFWEILTISSTVGQNTQSPNDNKLQQEPPVAFPDIRHVFHILVLCFIKTLVGGINVCSGLLDSL